PASALIAMRSGPFFPGAPRRKTDDFTNGFTLHDRPRKIRARLRRKPLAELFAQRARCNLFDRACRQLAQLKRPIRNADQPIHLQAKRAEHVPDLAVLALAHREAQPNVGALLALQRCLDRSVADAVHLDAVPQPLEPLRGDLAERPHAITPQPA